MLKPGRWLSVARARCLPYTLIATLSAVALGPSSGLACSCAPSPSALAELEEATQVFSGRVTALEDPYAEAVIQSSLDPVIVTVAVERVWEGDVGPTVKIKTARSGASCGFEFQKGEEYLVYAYDSYVSRCSRTKVLAAAAPDLTELGAGHEPAPETTAPSPRRTAVPEPTPEAAATGADDVRDYETCPAGIVPVEQRLDGYLDLDHLIGTYDRGCDGCTVVWCQAEPRQGPVVSYYPDGQVHMLGFYKDGKREGVWASWYPDGTTFYEGAWHADRKHGLWKLWYENGRPEAEIEYTDDVPDGRWLAWYENGQPSIEGAYTRGERSGIWRFWHAKGTLLAEGPGGRDPASAR